VELKGSSILLTGASGGIGQATAEQLARAGARLTLFARREEPLLALQHRVESLGGTAAVVCGDVRRVSDAERAVAEAVKRFGRLDGLVNNAGFGVLGLLSEVEDEDVVEQFETNVLGPYRVTRAALPALQSRGAGVVVNVASFAGKVGAPYYSFYNATKFALCGMSEAWRRELRSQGVQVALVLPAAVETEFLDRMGRERALGIGPAGTVLEPEAVARAIVDMLKRPRAEIYVPWWNRWLSLLNAVAPRLSDRIVTGLFRYPGGSR